MKKGCKPLSLLLALCLLLALLPGTALGAEIVASGTCGGEGDGSNLSWTLDSEGTLTISGTGAMSDDSRIFEAYTAQITKIVINPGVTTIGWALSGTSQARYLSLPETVSTLNMNLGILSGLENITVAPGNPFFITEDGVLFSKDQSILYCFPTLHPLFECYTIPDTVRRISRSAFLECNLNEIIIPEGVNAIELGAFWLCDSLSSITIPASVTEIANESFCGNNLTAIEVAADNPNYLSQDGVLFTRDGQALLQFPSGRGGSYSVPSGTKTILNSAFGNCFNITSVLLPEGVETIETFAFYAPHLTALSLPKSLKSIGSENYQGWANTALTDIFYAGSEADWQQVSVGDSNEALLNAAFHYNADPDRLIVAHGVCGEHLSWTLDSAGLLRVEGYGAMTDYSWDNRPPWYEELREQITRVELEEGVTTVGNFAFADCSLREIDLPDGITDIGNSAFSSSSINSISIPSSVSRIGDMAFESCYNLHAIDVSSENTIYKSLDGVLFTADMRELITYPINREASQYTVPDGVIRIAHSAFLFNRLNSVTLPGSLQSIGASAFYCGAIKELTIPSSVTEIGSQAFTCFELQNIAVAEGNPCFASSNGILFTLDGKRLVCYPAAKSEETYSIPMGTEELGDWSFFGSKALKHIVISDSVHIIGVSAFAVSGLTEITVPESVSVVRQWAFQSCASLRSAEFKNPNTTLENNVFNWCPALESVRLPAALDVLPWGTFQNCTSLQTIQLPAHLTTIEQSAFNSCSALKSIVIPDGVTIIGNNAFDYCENLETVRMGPDVTTIGGAAFGMCPSLRDIILPDSVTSMGTWVFNHCTSLTEIKLPAGLTELPDCAFYESGLRRITVPARVTRIGNWAFGGCLDLTEVTLPAGLREIGECAFYNDQALTQVFYNGSKTDWTGVTIGNGNDPLLNASIWTPAIPPLPGDVTGDGRADMEDARLLFRVASGAASAANASAADVNGDGKVNNRDAILLFRQLAGASNQP